MKQQTVYALMLHIDIDDQEAQLVDLYDKFLDAIAASESLEKAQSSPFYTYYVEPRKLK